MTASTSIGYSSIYQLKSTLDIRPDDVLKKETDQLSKNVRQLLLSERLGALPAPMLAQLFNLRVKAIKWFAANTNLDYADVRKEVASHVKTMDDDRLEVLKENLMFAVRCNQRVFDGIVLHASESEEKVLPAFSEISDLTYDQYISALAFSLPDEAFEKTITWTHASLQAEFVFIAADVIEESGLKVSDQLIDDLAALVADAAQNYFALSVELGFAKQQESVPQPALSNDEGFIVEQKELAELGLDEFAKNFPN